MRVIAGRLGGRRLRAPSGQATRPTSARVREALFAMLSSNVPGASVLDLFAGTGALGIEALSRGAARAVFVESEASALASLRANVAALGLEHPHAQVRAQDVLGALRAASARGESYDLVFIDPPYVEASTWAAQLASALAPVLAPGALVAVESDRRAPLRLGLAISRERRYGDTSLTIHSREEPMSHTEPSSESS